MLGNNVAIAFLIGANWLISASVNSLVFLSMIYILTFWAIVL